MNDSGTMTITRCTISNNSATVTAHQTLPIGPKAAGY